MLWGSGRAPLLSPDDADDDNIRGISMNAVLPMSLSELVHGRKRAR
jgi:hypothetical protein